MNILNLLMSAAIVCILLSIVSAILITAFLDRRGLKTPFPFINILLFRNLGRYKEITLKERGKIGPLFYLYVIPVNAALILALSSLVIRALRS